MDASEQGAIMVGRASGAMVTTMFGAVWLGLGLAAIHAFSWWVVVVFAVCCLGLYLASLHVLRRGKKLRSKAATPRWTAKMRNGFIWAVVAEIVGCLAVVWICNLLRRADLIPVGIALVVGLHFLPLAKIFRAPIYYATGIVIPFWCVASVFLFRGPVIDVAAAIGTGIVLWLTTAYGLIRVRSFLPAPPGKTEPDPVQT